MKKKLINDIASRMKRARNARGLTQAQISRYLSIDEEEYARIEAGEIFPGEIVYRRMRIEFGISLDWLLAGIGPMVVVEPYTDDAALSDGELAQMLIMIKRMPMLKHAMLGFFLEYQLKHGDLIERLLAEQGEKEGKVAEVGKNGGS